MHRWGNPIWQRQDFRSDESASATERMASHEDTVTCGPENLYVPQNDIPIIGLMFPVRVSYLRAPIARFPLCTYRDRELRYHRIVKLQSRAFTTGMLDVRLRHRFGSCGSFFLSFVGDSSVRIGTNADADLSTRRRADV